MKIKKKISFVLFTFLMLIASNIYSNDIHYNKNGISFYYPTDLSEIEVTGFIAFISNQEGCDFRFKITNPINESSKEFSFDLLDEKIMQIFLENYAESYLTPMQNDSDNYKDITIKEFDTIMISNHKFTKFVIRYYFNYFGEIMEKCVFTHMVEGYVFEITLTYPVSELDSKNKLNKILQSFSFIDY
jgi:hypothetical protein